MHPFSLGFWFPAQASNAGQIEASPEALLKERFTHAVHGNYCRTHGYSKLGTEVLGRKEWLDAVYIPAKGWVVRKREWIPQNN